MNCTFTMRAAAQQGSLRRADCSRARKLGHKQRASLTPRSAGATEAHDVIASVTVDERDTKEVDLAGLDADVIRLSAVETPRKHDSIASNALQEADRVHVRHRDRIRRAPSAPREKTGRDFPTGRGGRSSRRAMRGAQGLFPSCRDRDRSGNEARAA